ncbi:MAG TPA: LLM class flavin-dependent oxidoreductase [Chloroflexota bacterium]|jgi:alkanesulfonate monooxygenase SsuD/methylene tetrahydromethanopterin reductase-like flavin-dependent oxidoreductase (luciferase family)
MEFGTFTGFYVREGRGEHDAFDEWMCLAEVADTLGVDCYWLAEFHFRPHTLLSAPLVVGSAIAARTKRLKVGLGVQLLPLANPLRLAEECATLDHLSGGRLVYGIGRSSFLDSYQGYGVSYEESRPMFFEALEIMRRAWGDEPFSYEGQYYRFENVNAIPKPYQKPHPPIRVACESRASFALMGRLGFPILIRHQMELPELKQLLKEYEAERHQAGFPGPNQVTLQANCYLAETTAQAFAEAEYSTMRDRRIMRQFMVGRMGDAEAAARSARLRADPTYEDLARRLLYGTPEAIVERIEEYRETLGITGLSLNMNVGGQIPYERVVNSLRLLMERVAPHFN